jgi:hypothetical protein
MPYNAQCADMIASEWSAIRKLADKGGGPRLLVINRHLVGNPAERPVWDRSCVDVFNTAH